jgi:hypothetical protein
MDLGQKFKQDTSNMASNVKNEILTGGGTGMAKARSSFGNLDEEDDDDLYYSEEFEMDEVTSAGSAGGYSQALGYQKKELKEDEELTEINPGAYSQPAIWAKNYKNWKAVKDPNFPRYGGPGGKNVKIKEKCKHFPYCNQGDINSLDFFENKTLKKSIIEVSKKTNKPVNYIKNIIIKEVESKFKTDLRKYKNNKMKRYTDEEIEEIISRSFYKSPITSLVGGTKMEKPIGLSYSMKGNKPKYE